MYSAIATVAVVTALSQTAHAKYLVCTVTINSSDEACLFRKHLKPSGKFEFIELVPDQSDDACENVAGKKTARTGAERGQEAAKIDSDWFSKACERMKATKKGCDIVVLSGHFGGTFFREGGSGPRLPLETLEEKGCNNACPAIMNSPKEVFMFGCNTLAGKEPDVRTPEQYRAVLRDERDVDGNRIFADAQVDEIVALRYGAYGQATYDRMRRAFGGVPHLYGFYSKGPRGKDAVESINKYFKLVPNYADHIHRIETTEATEGILSALDSVQEINQTHAMAKPAIKNNDALDQAFGVKTKFTYLTQCSGSPGKDSAEFCTLFDESRSIATRLTSLKLLLTGSDGTKYLALAKQFFEKHPPETYDAEAKKKFIEIAQDPTVRERFTTMLAALEKMPGLALNLIDLGEKLSFMTAADATTKRQKVLITLINQGTIDAKDTVCSRTVWPEITASDLKAAVFLNANSLQALACLVPAPQVTEAEVKTLTSTLSGSSADGRRIAAWLLGMGKAASSDAHIALAKAIDDKDQRVREMAAWALHATRAAEPEVIARLATALGDKDTVVRRDAAYALSVIRSNDPAVRSQLETAKSGGDSIVAKLAWRALEQRKDVVIPKLNTATAKSKGSCADLDTAKIDDDTTCTSSKGVVFARVKSSTGETGWRDTTSGIVYFDELKTGVNQYEAESYCDDRPGQTLSSRDDLAIGESHGIREVIKPVRNYWVWSSSAHSSFPDVAFGLDGADGYVGDGSRYDGVFDDAALCVGVRERGK